MSFFPKNNFFYLGMSQPLPFQAMLEAAPIQILKMSGFHDPSSDFPHRHEFYMLYWTVSGSGAHSIDFSPFEMRPGRLFFLHQNQVHQVAQYPENGWMVLFNMMCFREFLKMNPKQEQNGLFDNFNNIPYVDLDDQLIITLNNIAALLVQELSTGINMDIAQNYLSILLLHAGQKYLAQNKFSISGLDTEIVRGLKVLIEANFRSKRTSSFYAAELGQSPRKLNELTFRTMGVSVQDIINQRLLAEIEAALVGSNISVKQLAYDLGFTDQPHLTTFFKKHRAETPVAFKNRYLPPHNYTTKAASS
ncbi:hypothetical protein AB669_00425 [Pedobacter sp. BMA]|nr:hypothetical protein AB669_00425 [Pedobacter sp. BMA]